MPQSRVTCETRIWPPWPLRIDLGTAALGSGAAQLAAVQLELARVFVGAELLEQRRRPLDVAEQEGDGARGRGARRSLAPPPKDRPRAAALQPRRRLATAPPQRRVAAGACAELPSATTRFRSVPIPVIAISTVSPTCISTDPSAPIQRTSPAYIVMYLVVSTMKSNGSKIMSAVAKLLRCSPSTVTLVVAPARSKSVAIHGPIGLNVSAFFARQNVRSAFCQVRALTSLPIVQPNTASRASSRELRRRRFPMTATTSGSASRRPS